MTETVSAIEWISPKIQLWIDSKPPVHRNRLMILAAMHAANLHDLRVVRDRYARLSAFKRRCWARRTYGRSYLHSSECNIVPWNLVKLESEWRGWMVVIYDSNPLYLAYTLAMYKVSKFSVIEKRATIHIDTLLNLDLPEILDEILNTTPASDLAHYIVSFNQTKHKG